MNEEIIQGSVEWFALRSGKVTASRIGDLMRQTKKGWGADRKHYMGKLVAERITGKPMIQRTVASLERRLEVEPDARAAYEFYSDNQVTEVGFIEHPAIPDCGASPDGLVDEDGGIEIKCCDTPAHIEMLTTGAIDPDYVLQCHFGMACTGREWWDFVSFDPLMPEDLKLYVQRIGRDNNRIAEIESSVIEFLAEVDSRVRQLIALSKGVTPLAAALEGELYGGGKQSDATGVLIAEGRLPVPERALIVDTGREASTTWRYLAEHMQPMLDTVGLTVEIVPHSYSAVDLYDKHGSVLIPGWTKGGSGQLRTFCSGEWKRDAAYRWLREAERGYGPQNPIYQWLGYSLDEIGRCKPSRRQWAEVQWPLIMGYGITVTRKQCVEIILAAGIPEPVKSSCWCCPFRTNAEWADQKENEPEDHAKAIALDHKIAATDERGGIFLHHSGVPLDKADLTIPAEPEQPLFRASDNCNGAGCFT